MAKLYTLDGKLLTETPEIRVGEKIYPVDNRQKTVAKFQKEIAANDSDDPMQGVRKALELAFGPKAAAEIDGMNMPYPAYQKLFTLVIAAMTDDDPAAIEARFRGQDNPA